MSRTSKGQHPGREPSGGVDEVVPRLTDADFYHAFVKLSPDGMWRVEVDPPISVTLPEEQQIEQLFENTRFVECNYAFTRMSRLPKSRTIAGCRFNEIFPASSPENLRLVQEIVRSGYHLVGSEYSHPGVRSGDRWFYLSFLGVIKDNLLKGGWGTQQDITDTKIKARTQAALYQISQASSATQNLLEFFKTIHETLNGLMPANNLFIALYDPAHRPDYFPLFRR